MTRTALAVLAAFLATTGARRAEAQENEHENANAPPAIALRYDVAPSRTTCPSAADFTAEVERMLGVDPFREGASLRVSVELREGARRDVTEGRVAFSGASADDPDLPWGGEQTIHATDCGELVRTIALVMTVAVERLRSARSAHVRETPRTGQVSEAPPSDAPDASNAPSQGGAREPPAHPWPKTTARSLPLPSLHASSSAGVVATANITPGASIGTSFGARLRFGAVSAGLEGMLLAPSSAASSGGAGGSVSAKALVVTVCWHVAALASKSIDVHACPVVAPFLLRGVGQSPARARTGDAASLTLGGRLGGGVDVLGPIRAEVELDALAPLTRHVFAIDQENVWVQPTWGFAAHGNVAVRFR